MCRVLLIGEEIDRICQGKAIYIGTAHVLYNLSWFYEGVQHSCREGFNVDTL